MNSQYLSSISEAELFNRLKGDGIWLKLSPFTAHIKSEIPVVAEGLYALYAANELLDPTDSFADFHVSVSYDSRFPKRTCVFKTDEYAPFTPLAAGEAFAFLEWGLNWCVTTYCHTWITVHSAVLERNGRALIMPAPPGSGKSTLCAALILNGWRLLSDEMALIDPTTGLVTPAPRPVSLKNESIQIIRNLNSSVEIGPVAYDTMKGNVAHMRAPSESLLRAREAVLPGWIVFPKYVLNANADLHTRGKAASLMQFTENSFNQSVHGKRGFEALSDLVDKCDCYDFTYSRLEDAIALFANLPLPL